MKITYDMFIGAFLAKITEYDFAKILDEDIRSEIVEGYMRISLAEFNKICKFDLSSNANENLRLFDVDIPDGNVDEILHIVSEGMVVQWLKPYLYNQELLQLTLNTADFSSYSSANLLAQIGNAHATARKDYRNLMNLYTYNAEDLTELHT